MSYELRIEDTKKPKKARTSARVFTIGYEGRSPEDFWKTLEANGVTVLADVRSENKSRIASFSGRYLVKFADSHGIEYVHLPSLGSPEAARRAYKKTRRFESFRKMYERHLKDATTEFNMLALIASQKPTVVLCFEDDPARCHRGIIADKLKELGFEVKHL